MSEICLNHKLHKHTVFKKQYKRVSIPNVASGLSFPGYLNSFEELQAEECGILNGCENGRCVRVQEGYTCDCFDGYHLDMAKMTCVGKNNVCLRGNESFPEIPCGQISYSQVHLRQLCRVSVGRDEENSKDGLMVTPQCECT